VVIEQVPTGKINIGRQKTLSIKDSPVLKEHSVLRIGAVLSKKIFFSWADFPAAFAIVILDLFSPDLFSMI